VAHWSWFITIAPLLTDRILSLDTQVIAPDKLGDASSVLLLHLHPTKLALIDTSPLHPHKRRHASAYYRLLPSHGLLSPWGSRPIPAEESNDRAHVSRSARCSAGFPQQPTHGVPIRREPCEPHYSMYSNAYLTSKQGIYIGGTFYAMTAFSENIPHDLYLRASSATKKTPPFKLHANVIGKFNVQRELSPGVGASVREKTADALNQRASRTTIRLDDPQAERKKPKKEPAPAASSSKTPSLIDKAKIKAVTAAARTAGKPISNSNALEKLSAETVADIRRRLIHFLAPQDRQEEETVKALGGSNCSDQIRRAIYQLLEQVGSIPCSFITLQILNREPSTLRSANP